MEHIIIGTAGHIDHGKTTLIKALTGRDTDRLEEEKRRGITIDLGFTYFDLPGGDRAGIIDVPGHEKFIHNMVAGVVGMDLVLLVIALDEGIMPQTTEHMEILSQLGVAECIIVLNKADCVDNEWADMVTEDVRETLSSTTFAGSPIAKVSSKTGEGISDLVNLISAKAKTMNRKKNTSGAFRLPVDRVFSMPGYGTIVTGTLIEGSIHREDVVRLFPGETISKIRGIQVHGAEVQECSHGQRVALNLANVKKEEVCRGNVIASPDSLENTLLLDVRMNIIKSTARVIENRTRLHLYLGTEELLCRAVLLDRDKIGPGESGLVQLRLEKPLAVKKGDHFVIRFFSPLETVGGGIVLDAQPGKRKRFDEQTISMLNKKEEGKDRDIVEDILSTAFHMPLNLQQLMKSCDLEEWHLKGILEELEQEGIAVIIPGNKKDFYWNYDDEKRTELNAVRLVTEFHERNPYKAGISKSGLMTGDFKNWQMDKFDAVLKLMLSKSLLKRTGDNISLPGFQIVKDSTYECVAKTITDALHKAGFDFIRFEDIGFGTTPKEQVLDILSLMQEEGTIIKVSEDFYTLSSFMKEAEEKIRAYLSMEPVISIAVLRDLLGTSRRSAKPLLFYMDKVKVTRFDGKETERIAY